MLLVGLLPHYVTHHVQGNSPSLVRAPEPSQPVTQQTQARVLEEKIKKVFSIHLNILRNSFSPFAELVVHSQLARLHILKNIFLLGSGIPRYNQAVQQRNSHLQLCPTVPVPSSHNHFSLCSYPGQAHHRAALAQSVLLPLLLLHLLPSTACRHIWDTQLSSFPQVYIKQNIEFFFPHRFLKGQFFFSKISTC